MSNTTFTLVFAAMMITIMILHGCSTSDVYFRGECHNLRHSFWGLSVFESIDCSMPSESEVVDLTGDPYGESGMPKNGAADIILRNVAPNKRVRDPVQQGRSGIED